MNSLGDWFLRADIAGAPLDVPAVLLALMLAFLAGQTVAWIYILTHSGLSYSRSFVNALIILPILVALLMIVLSNNIVVAFGMMAVFAIVRFRNILRDTLDTTYILSVIVIGMAVGTQRFPVGVAALVMLVLVYLYLAWTSFGARHRFDLIVNLHWTKTIPDLLHLTRLLERHALKLQLASQRSSEGYEGVDLSYRVLLRNNNRVDDLLSELRELPGVSRLTSLKAEDQSEL